MSLTKLVDIFYVLSTFLLENALTLNGNEKNHSMKKLKLGPLTVSDHFSCFTFLFFYNFFSHLTDISYMVHTT